MLFPNPELFAWYPVYRRKNTIFSPICYLNERVGRYDAGIPVFVHTEAIGVFSEDSL